ncbi:hypothetical protein C8039_07005 [Halogeometricum sp. wsp3]|nr:hypothetical protein C8039_07005 [Halogeometricum sp. wsp3]
MMTSGRQVERSGRGSETRNTDPSVEFAASTEKRRTRRKIGIDGGDLVVISSTDRGSVLVKARVTDRPNDREVFLPYHWGGVFKRESGDKYPTVTSVRIGDSATPSRLAATTLKPRCGDESIDGRGQPGDAGGTGPVQY